MKPTEGMIFFHSRIRVNGRQAGCEVTRVTATTVYFLSEDGKRRSVDLLCFGQVCARVFVPAVSFSSAA